MVTQKCLVIVVLCVLFSAVVTAQDATQAAPPQEATKDANQAAPPLTENQRTALIREFTRSSNSDGVMLQFILLTNKTVDALFSGDGKYAMRARANTATTFFIQGVIEKNLIFNPKFTVEQDGKTITGESINFKNLQAGSLNRGDRVEGLLQLSQKIDVTHPFKIKGNRDSTAEFKLSAHAIKLLED